MLSVVLFLNKNRLLCPQVLRDGLNKYYSFHGILRKKKLVVTEEDGISGLDMLIKAYQNKIIYSSVIENRCLKLMDKRQSSILRKAISDKKIRDEEDQNKHPLALCVEYLSNSEESAVKSLKPTSDTEILQPELTQSISQCPKENKDIDVQAKNSIPKLNWMSDYDNYDESDSSKTNSGGSYGTPISSYPISTVPCGGCGALLHCKDQSLPGYIPSEIFKNSSAKGGSNLEAVICQRCYFLQNYNLALQVKASPEDYLKVLKTISHRKALIVLMVDLLDFPCSVWPGIPDLLSNKTPIVVVGNKVDLLPQDNKTYMERIRKTLLLSLKNCGFTMLNIKHVALISAKTGFGIEELITTLHSVWKHKGDVYLLGCTNVGKSTLFNALLKSDYCKSDASDLIQKATTSLWPGTTLNLLRFPILRPSAQRLYLRHERLKQSVKLYLEEKKMRKEALRVTNNPEFALPVGHVAPTFPSKKYINLDGDAFQLHCHTSLSGTTKLGVNAKAPEYAMSRWFYDTPGIVQEDQIIHLLTPDELNLTVPSRIIRGQTFCLKPSSTIFIGGLARLDYIEGPFSIRLTVFRSHKLPITICKTCDSDEIYEALLGSELFMVPENKDNRLSSWPGLQLTNCFTLGGVHFNVSCKDVVLSNAGWIAIACDSKKQYRFQAWTPQKRGVYIRDCLLPYAVSLRGPRIKNSPAYKTNRLYLK